MSDQDQTITHYAHRTGYDTGQRCPRKWYWTFVWNQVGIVRARTDIPLARGIYVHRGLEALLKGQPVDLAIKFALDEFDKEIGERGLDVGSMEESSYVYKEQKALIEAMLYGWAKRRLPTLLEQYEILEVEKEEEWDLGIYQTPAGPCRLMWLGKADALLREYDTNDLFIQSFKTTAEWDSRKDSAATHDVQGLSELCAVEHRLNDWWRELQKGDEGDPTSYSYKARREIPARMFDFLRSLDHPPKIMGIRMEHLLAGTRMDPGKGAKKTGQKVQYSPLIRAYKKDGITPDLDEWAWKYSWDDEFGNHRLGKGWRPLNMWEQPGGVRGWIDKTVDLQIQAELGDCLDQQFVWPQPYYRQQEDVEDWTQQMIAEELRKFEAKQRIRSAQTEDEFRFILNTLFPQHRHSCDYPRLCEDAELCFSPGFADAPIQSGLYKFRDGHHAAEIILINQIRTAEIKG